MLGDNQSVQHELKEDKEYTAQRRKEQTKCFDSEEDKLSKEIDGKEGNKSFKEASLSSSNKVRDASLIKESDTLPLIPSTMLKMEGGNVVVQIDEQDYQKAIKYLQFSVIGHLTLHKYDSVPTIMEVQWKLASF